MMKRYRLTVQLELLGPILTQGSGAVEPGIDAPVARDADGNVMLPFSLVKGKILDAFRELRPSAFENIFDTARPKLVIGYKVVDQQIASWLGVQSGDGKWEPERGRLTFTDFVARTPEQKSQDHDGIIERIQIDAATGSVGRGMLVMIEAPYGYGEPVTFVGHIDFIADDAEAKVIQAELQKAFETISAFGAMRTIGFGRRKKTEIKPASGTSPHQAQGTPPTSALLPIRYSLDRPFCVVGRKHSGNHFDSLDKLPGQVLKGAVARLILLLNGSPDAVIDPLQNYPLFKNICKYFDKICFGEAKPMVETATARPIEPPLTIVTSPTKKGEYFDVAHCPHALLIAGAAPAFCPDWKDADSTRVHDAFGWSYADRERRVRTAINPESWKADDSKLFSYGLVRPKGFIWEGTIGLHQIPQSEHQLVRDELKLLLAEGLPNIGKTRAIASIEWLGQRTPPKVGTSAGPAKTHVITLQTDCMMTNPESLKTKSLHDVYAEFWHDVSGGSLKLVRFFAKQTLHGGFVSRRANKHNYKPFLLTDRGSTFVMEVVDPTAANTFLNKLQEQPLPTASWVDNDWKVCPFLPHVGYGEVVVDLECHTARMPA